MVNMALGDDDVIIGSNSVGFGNTALSLGRRNLLALPDSDKITYDGGQWILDVGKKHNNNGNKMLNGAAVGTGNGVLGRYGVAVGNGGYVASANGTAIGYGAQSVGQGAIAIGKGMWQSNILPSEYWRLAMVNGTNRPGDTAYSAGKYAVDAAVSPDPGGFRVSGENAVGLGAYGQVRGDGAIMIAAGEAPYSDAAKQKEYKADGENLLQAKLKLATQQGVLDEIKKEANQNGLIAAQGTKDLVGYLNSKYGGQYNLGSQSAAAIAAALGEDIGRTEADVSAQEKAFRQKWLEGKYSFVEGDSAVGLGLSVQVYGDRSLAMGNHAVVGSADAPVNDAIAVGGYVKVTGKNSLVFGFGGTELVHKDGTVESLSSPQYNLVSGRQSILLGSYSSVSGDHAFGIGNNVSVGVDYGISLGDYSSVSGAFGLNFGYGGAAGGANSINIGSDGSATAENALNFGTNGAASGLDSINIGTHGKAADNNAIAIGYQGQALADNTIALGGFSVADHNKAIAIGSHSTVQADNSASVGVGSTILARDSLSLGNGNQIAINRKIPLGVLSDGDISQAVQTVSANLDAGGAIAEHIAAAQAGNDAAALSLWNGYKQEALEAIGKADIAARAASYQAEYEMLNAVEGTQRDEKAIDLAKQNAALWQSYQEEAQTMASVTDAGTAADFKRLRAKLLGSDFIADERRLTSEELAAYRLMAAKAYDVPLHDVVALGNNITQTTLNSVFLGNKSAYVAFHPEDVTPAQPLVDEEGRVIVQANGAVAYTPVADEGNTTRGIDNTYTNEVVYTYRRTKDGQIEIIRVSHDFAGARNVAGIVSVGGDVIGYDEKTIKVTDPETGAITDKTVQVPIVSTRRIQNVAPGLLSPTSSDAVNGSQLYALGHVVGNLATSVADQIGPNATITEDGKLIFDDGAYGIGGTESNPTRADTLVDFINLRRIEVQGDTDWRRGENGIWNKTVNGPGMAEIRTETAADGHTVYEVHVDQFMDTQARSGNDIAKAGDNYWYETAELDGKTYVPEEDKWFAKADTDANERQSDGKWYAKADIQDKTYVQGKWYRNDDLGEDGKTFYEGDQKWYNTSDMVNGKPVVGASPVTTPEAAPISEAAVAPIANPNKAVLENVLIDPNNHTPTLLNGVESLFEGKGTGNGAEANTETGDIGVGTNEFAEALRSLPVEKSHYAATIGDLQKLADTPIFFSGNAGTAGNGKTAPNTFSRMLSQHVNIVGDIALSKTDAVGKAKELAGKVTDGNIGVVSNGADTLTVKLASELQGLQSVTTTETADDGTTKTTVVSGGGVKTNGHIVVTGDIDGG